MNKIKIETTVESDADKVWEYWTNPEHITRWNHASDDWHSPRGTNDLREGGRFNIRMEAKDGSSGFDFEGEYTEVVPNQKISYIMDDGRKVEIVFENLGNKTRVTESFDPESKNSLEMQRSGWQAILDNFKKYTEGN